MSKASHLSDALLGLFSDSHNGWFSPFTVTIGGLTSVQASVIPAPRMNSIWAVANHVRLRHDLILHRFRGLAVDRKALGAENGWPPPGNSNDQAAWQETCERVITLNKELSELVASLSDDDLAKPPEGGKAN